MIEYIMRKTPGHKVGVLAVFEQQQLVCTFEHTKTM